MLHLKSSCLLSSSTSRVLDLGLTLFPCLGVDVWAGPCSARFLRLLRRLPLARRLLVGLSRSLSSDRPESEKPESWLLWPRLEGLKERSAKLLWAGASGDLTGSFFELKKNVNVILMGSTNCLGKSLKSAIKLIVYLFSREIEFYLKSLWRNLIYQFFIFFFL